MKRVLVFGSTGKMGSAIKRIMSHDYKVIDPSSSDINVLDNHKVEECIDKYTPDIVVNAVAFTNIDPCDESPEYAFNMNAIFPSFLAKLSIKYDYKLVHFSSDAVFPNLKDKGQYYYENSVPAPSNIYGVSKIAGDLLVSAIANKYYIIRLSLLFGVSDRKNQFIEKMLDIVEGGAGSLDIADDIIISPGYSVDIAEMVKYIIDENLEFGLYHVTNKGSASLYDVISLLMKIVHPEVAVNRASYKQFPHKGKKNTCTPMASLKINQLSTWQDAVRRYANEIASHTK